jgi:hypothetical protein
MPLPFSVSSKSISPYLLLISAQKDDVEAINPFSRFSLLWFSFWRGRRPENSDAAGSRGFVQRITGGFKFFE